MKKIWLFIATLLVGIGGIVFTLTMTACSWDFSKLSTQNNIINSYEFSEDFNDISIETDTADITFVSSADGKCKVVCKEFEKETHSVVIENGALTIKAVNERKWYDYIGIGIGKTALTVYLPKTQYQSLAIKEDTGDIQLGGFTFGKIDMELSTGDVELTGVTCLEELKISVTTGEVELQDVTCKTLLSEGDTGDISLERVSAEEKISIQRTTGDTELDSVTCKALVLISDTGESSLENVLAGESISVKTTTGDVELEKIDAAEIVIETDTGDVKGSLLTGKTFETDTDTGKVRVPDDEAGGTCKITTSTGDIRITIEG